MVGVSSSRSAFCCPNFYFFPAPCFSETNNRQKTVFRVSEKHAPLPNLCHTHCVTAITRRNGPTGQRTTGPRAPETCGPWSCSLVVFSACPVPWHTPVDLVPRPVPLRSSASHWSHSCMAAVRFPRPSILRLRPKNTKEPKRTQKNKKERRFFAKPRIAD